MTPVAMISPTAAPAASTLSNAASITFAHAGFGSSLTVTSTITPSRPSEPVITASRSKPAASSAGPPMVSRSPSMVTISSARMLCTVRPYFRQCRPPEFSATLPPMLHAI